MITQTQTTSFKKELYEGVHDLTADALYIALYTASANLNEATTEYTSEHEVVGGGYIAGGLQLTGATVSAYGSTAYVSFDNANWVAVSFTCRGALIYNASKGNKSIAVLDFGSDKTVSGGLFLVSFPANSATTAVIRSS